MRILITNDDGIDSPGLAVLAEVALASGHEVLVAAPNRQYSGFGAGLDCSENDAGLITSPHDVHTQAGVVEGISVHASPAMITYAAGLGAFGTRPDLVLSGINHGANVGAAVVHSGTVGAAMAASMQGIPAMATSSVARSPQHWQTHRGVITTALNWMLDHVHDNRVLNVNIPDIPESELLGIRSAPLAPISLDTLIWTGMLHEPIFEALADLSLMPTPGYDASYLSQGWATLSFLSPPAHIDEGINLPVTTAHQSATT